MFGFPSKVKSILHNNFNYRPDMHQSFILKDICKQAKLQGVNEYDAAIMFMMDQMNSLQGGGDDVKAFIGTHCHNIKSVLSLAHSPYSEIIAMLTEIEKNHGMVSGTDAANSGNPLFPTFEDWISEFKHHCGKYNPGLKVDDNGESLVDFVDHAPLKRAFHDRVSPEEVAKAFAPQFDPSTFGRG